MDSEPAAIKNKAGDSDREDTWRWFQEVTRAPGFRPVVAIPESKTATAREFLGVAA